MGLDLDPLDDLFSVGVTSNARVAGKFQPKCKLQKPRKDSASTSTSSHVFQINNSVDTKFSEPITTASPSENNYQWDSRSVRPLHEKNSTEGIPKVDALYPCEDAVINTINITEKSIGENADIFIGLESLDVFISSTTADIEGTTSVQETIPIVVPNSEIGGGLAIPVLSSVVDSIQTSKSVDARSYAFTAGETNLPGSPCDGAVHLNTIELETEEMGVPLNDEPVNLMDMSQRVSDILQECDTRMPVKLASRRPKTGMNEASAAIDTSQQQEAKFTERGRSLRPQKSKQNQLELEDDSENEVADKDFSDEYPSYSFMEENVINDQEHQTENEFRSNKVKMKSKQPDVDKGEKYGKRKMAKAASEQDAHVKSRKFSHSTRRRKVDKTLLETPEDEIDYQKVPLRDLILLADHKERHMRKHEAVARAQSTKESNCETSEIFNEDRYFSSKTGERFNDGHVSPAIKESSFYLNYQTYMDKKPSARWSKQDTELFYEAVQQFGTDLSLIQQLFPGRTRRQVKLKYKKEERQHPMRLREALTHRFKDHSHFEKVIERLNQIAAEENENADKQASAELGGNDLDDHGIPDINVEEAKTEQHNEEDECAIQDLADDTSPLKPYDSEDDMFRWSQYKSDI